MLISLREQQWQNLFFYLNIGQAYNTKLTIYSKPLSPTSNVSIILDKQETRETKY